MRVSVSSSKSPMLKLFSHERDGEDGGRAGVMEVERQRRKRMKRAGMWDSGRKGEGGDKTVIDSR